MTHLPFGRPSDSALTGTSTLQHNGSNPLGGNLMRVRAFILGAIAFALLVPVAASAQIEVTADPVECIAEDTFTPVTAQVTNIPPEATVRFYFRRLHQETEDFYYIEMTPRGDGVYWGVLPKPTDDELAEFELDDPQNEEEEDYPVAAWWRTKDLSEHRDPNDELDEDVIDERADVGRLIGRDWLRNGELSELEEWFEEQEEELEPADYYAAVVDPSGRELARSPVSVTPVNDECEEPELTAEEEGQSHNLVIGETAPWQYDRRVFHWQCDGIVSRIDYQGILYVDRHCRACAFVWLKGAVPAGVGVLAAVLEEDTENPPPEPASPEDPDDDDDDEQ